ADAPPGGILAAEKIVSSVVLILPEPNSQRDNAKQIENNNRPIGKGKIAHAAPSTAPITGSGRNDWPAKTDGFSLPMNRTADGPGPQRIAATTRISLPRSKALRGAADGDRPRSDAAASASGSWLQLTSGAQTCFLSMNRKGRPAPLQSSILDPLAHTTPIQIW